MNSTVMPDKILPEDQFRDHLYTTRFLKSVKTMNQLNKPFMAAIGFKLPHIALHVPYRYYAMYKNKTLLWKLNKKELRFPLSSPVVAHRCCADYEFTFMLQEGSIKSDKQVYFSKNNPNFGFSSTIRDELMLGYCGAITYLDYQLGRILDVMDELNLWETTTLVLTADHGMDNGEKGLWYVLTCICICEYVRLCINLCDSECLYMYVRLCGKDGYETSGYISDNTYSY